MFYSIAKDLIIGLLTVEPEKRMTIEQAMVSLFYTKIDIISSLLTWDNKIEPSLDEHAARAYECTLY